MFQQTVIGLAGRAPLEWPAPAPVSQVQLPDFVDKCGNLRVANGGPAVRQSVPEIKKRAAMPAHSPGIDNADVMKGVRP